MLIVLDLSSTMSIDFFTLALMQWHKVSVTAQEYL